MYPIDADSERNPPMKRTLFVCLLALLLLLSACTPSFEGYQNVDMTQYVTLGDYFGVTYTKTEVTVTDAEVDQAIDAVRTDNMIKTEIPDAPAAKNDYVVIDYTTKVEKGTVSALSGTDQTFAVGSAYTLTEIPGFADSLIGKKQGETYVFTLTFPADYKNDKISDITLVAGKEATVEVVIDSLFSYVKPELTDEFVTTVSKTAKTVAEYREEIRTQLLEEAQLAADNAKRDEVWNAVLEVCRVKKYPKSELEAYRTEMQKYYEDYASYYGYELEEFLSQAYGYSMTEFEEKKEEYAESSVKSDMALYAIAAAEGVTVTEEEYKAGLTRYFELTGAELGLKTEEEFETYYTKEMITQSVLWDEVIELLCEHAVGVEKTEEETAAESAKP